MEIGYIRFAFPVHIKDTHTWLAPMQKNFARRFKCWYHEDKDQFEIIFDPLSRLQDKTWDEALELCDRDEQPAEQHFVFKSNVAHCRPITPYLIDKQKERVVEGPKTKVIKKGKGKDAYKPAAKAQLNL